MSWPEAILRIFAILAITWAGVKLGQAFGEAIKDKRP